MLKISFFLKKPNDVRGSLEYITISNPRKVLEGKLAGVCYVCDVYLSDKEIRAPIYSANPINALCSASEFVKMQLQILLSHGYIINEVESEEPWKLEKKAPQLLLQEKINEIKNNKEISQEDKDKILEILKKTFGGESSPIKNQINKLI